MNLSTKLDEILNPTCLRPGCKVKHRAKPAEAKEQILQAFKDELQEVDSVPVTADEDVEEGYTRAVRHYEQSLAEGYNMAIRDIKDRWEKKL